MPGTAKPGIDRLLIEAALDPVFRRRLVEQPDEVFPAFDLSEEQQDILRTRDDRLLGLLGTAVMGQSSAEPKAPAAEPAATPPVARQLPDMQLALTVAPLLGGQPGEPPSLSFATWVNPLPAGTDPDTLSMPDGANLPGTLLTPLRAVIHVAAQQLADAGGRPQIGLTASLLRASNVSAPVEPRASGEGGEEAAFPDIWIAGLGITTVGQMTREVEQALRASQEVLYLDAGVATRQVLAELCPRVTSLYEATYSEEHSRATGYERVAEKVVEAALDHAPVTFALHGHPLVAALPPFLVMEKARAKGLTVRVLPGISAIDTVLADLRVDPVVHGIQMYEATDLLLRRRPLQADVPALIWQIGPLETCLHSMRVSTAERFVRFVGHLKLFYPARHEVTAIYCSPHPLLPPKILRFAIEDMGLHAAEMHQGFSLYIPPALGRAIADWELAGNLESPEHLRKITR